jgi:hypothetical protein
MRHGYCLIKHVFCFFTYAKCVTTILEEGSPMKRLIAIILGTWLLTVASGAGATIILTTGMAGSDKETLTDLTLGNTITFDYMFSAVTYYEGPWLGLNASVINSLLVPFPAGQFNDYTNSTTGWLMASIDTTSGFGTVHDLAFTADTFGQMGNSAVVEIRNVAIDGQLLNGVPEPTTLALMGVGLAGIGFARRKKKT